MIASLMAMEVCLLRINPDSPLDMIVTVLKGSTWKQTLREELTHADSGSLL